MCNLENSDTKIYWSNCTLIFLSISDICIFLLTLAQIRRRAHAGTTHKKIMHVYTVVASTFLYLERTTVSARNEKCKLPCRTENNFHGFEGMHIFPSACSCCHHWLLFFFQDFATGDLETCYSHNLYKTMHMAL